MKVRPPYLFHTIDGESGSSIAVRCDVDTAVIEMVVRGGWNKCLALDTYTALRKCFAEHPAAIIVSLDELKDPAADSAAMWLAADRAATGLQPPVQIALHIPAARPLTHRLHRMGVSRTVPIFSTLQEAHTAVEDRRPLTDRLQLTRLAPQAESAGSARGLIDVVCEAWNLADLRHPGRLVVSELVANAVEYANTTMVVTVWRRRSGLHLSVRDGNPRLPSGGDGDGGHGLQIVDTLSAAWGAMSTRDGKMVWATLRSVRRTSQ